jgi:hypothetical protein
MEARVGIEPKTMLKVRKLLILLNAKNAKTTESAQAGYTAGTRQPGIFDAAGVCATNCGAAVAYGCLRTAILGNWLRQKS